MDLFSKVVLTVIAACLVLLTLKSFQPVRAVAKVEAVQKIDLVRIGGYYVTKSEILDIGKNERR